MYYIFGTGIANDGDGKHENGLIHQTHRRALSTALYKNYLFGLLNYNGRFFDLVVLVPQSFLGK